MAPTPAPAAPAASPLLARLPAPAPATAFRPGLTSGIPLARTGDMQLPPPTAPVPAGTGPLPPFAAPNTLDSATAANKVSMRRPIWSNTRNRYVDLGGPLGMSYWQDGNAQRVAAALRIHIVVTMGVNEAWWREFTGAIATYQSTHASKPAVTGLIEDAHPLLLAAGIAIDAKDTDKDAKKAKSAANSKDRDDAERSERDRWVKQRKAIVGDAGNDKLLRDIVVTVARGEVGKINALDRGDGKKYGAERLLEYYEKAIGTQKEPQRGYILKAGKTYWEGAYSWCGIFSTWAVQQAIDGVKWQQKPVGIGDPDANVENAKPGDIIHERDHGKPLNHYAIVVSNDGETVTTVNGKGIGDTVNERTAPLAEYDSFQDITKQPAKKAKTKGMAPPPKYPGPAPMQANYAAGFAPDQMD